ncbi:MAG: VCBS repeat-containing protein [Candidatus Poseidoniales archaeon]|nr:MAG: VCBS repeat-containing protein [Candidatus Poseidoniales archaeon]
MFAQNDLSKARMRSIFLTLLMVLSTTAALATTASASVARTYTTHRDPLDIAIGDFDCDGYNDLAIATDGTHTMTILYNDGNGNYNDRQDLWVAGNQSRNADWDDYANVEAVEVGDFNGDSVTDIVIYQRNNPFKQNDAGAPAGEPGNVTIIQNDGCGNRDWTIGQRFTHFIVFDLKVGDADQDGNDDIYVLELEEDLSRQNIVTYRGPITATTQGSPTFLGLSSLHTYTTFEVGDYGETQSVGIGSSCTDDDIFLLRGEGYDYTTGTSSGNGNDDNVTIVEYSCTGSSLPGSYPADITATGANPTVIQFGHLGSADLDIADIGGNGYIDTIAMMESYSENVSYVTASAQGTFGTPQTAYFGPYISYAIAVEDLNGDGEADFVNPTIAYQENTTDSAGGTESLYYLNPPTTVQVTLSDGNGGHVSPLSYEAGRRPSAVAVGQLQGDSSSAPDLAIGHANYYFGSWRDNLGWEGQYDTIMVIEMDNKDMAVTDVDINPTDRYYGLVGEGTRNINVTVTNTGMDILNGQTADLDLELKVVDEANSTNTTVYANDWDSPEIKTGCGTGCSWTFEEYVDGATNWHLETNHSTGASTGNNGPNSSANYLNPTDFMWAGNMKTNSSGDEWSGYGKNWDDAMVLNDVDLTGADRAFMSAELFRHLGFGALGQNTANGPILTEVMDDLAIIEIYSEDNGWSLIACPGLAVLTGACFSGESIWGGFDRERFEKQRYNLAPEQLIYGLLSGAFGTYYGWDNFTEEDLGFFDLSPWAGETVDIRFRFRTGFTGSTADDNESRWEGRDGFAVDNLTIWKQNTAFLPNPQTQSTTIGPFTNLEPGQDFTTSIQADLLNDTTYRISATLSNNAWDEQVINDDIVDYVTPFNLYDPMVESIDYFKPGSLYARGIYDIAATTNNYGNTEVDFDVEATVYSATPSDVYCGTPSAVCKEDFEGGGQGSRYEESADGIPKGEIYDENSCSTKIFNSKAYWFGHPCDRAQSYDDAWANETLIIPNIDLTSVSGDFVSLNFEYYADTFYRTFSSGASSPYDYVSMYVDFTKNVTKNGTTTTENYHAEVRGQWNDYNEDGTCNNDDDGNGLASTNESIDYTEIIGVGDPQNRGTIDTVFYNTDELVKTASIDLTHLYVQNRSGPSWTWEYECLTLKGSMANFNFTFQSNDDGRNGVNDGFKGVGFNNITLQEYTFIEDATYTATRTNVDAEGSALTTIGSHEFEAGVYRVDVRSIFDNTTAGTSWFGANELSQANNVERVIFNVESVDVTISSPNTLKCLKDQTQECVLPIDSSLDHSWDYSALNGVLVGEYVFYMDIHKMDGTPVHSMNTGTPVPLDSQERYDFSFTPWENNANGQQWVDGTTYNISVYAKLADGTETGNVRHFIATFKDTVDVAILSDSSLRTTAIKQDLNILGMTYTEFEVTDWETYFYGGWFAHYNKIILPWQELQQAKDAGAPYFGGGYYEELAEGGRRTVLQNFMNSGGTVQAHLGPLGEQIYGNDQQGLAGRLPFSLDIKSRNATNQVTFATMDLADPYHPIMDNIDVGSFQGFDSNSGVAQAVLNTQIGDTNTVPDVCGGYMESDGSFQRIIRYTEDIRDTVLGVCSYGEGGLIVSTIDVATHSDRADSVTFPLLGNMIKYQVSPYPENFNLANLEITINGDEPKADDNGVNFYDVYHMKSNAEITFGFNTAATVSLHADWIIDGPTSWDGSTLASGVTGHTNETSPTMTFCKSDLASLTKCAQGQQWHITLMLHDNEGHARIIDITVETNDVEADEERPEADATIDMRTEYQDNVKFKETKTVQNVDWDVYRIILQGEGDDAELVIHFDASNSSDADALEGNGIFTYEWKVLFDVPYGGTEFDTTGHTYTLSEASGGMWSYKFKNITVDPTGTVEQQIRMELVVTDKAQKFSEKFRMYFVVVPEGFGDEEPEIQWDNVQLNSSKFDQDTLTISGQVLSGAETNEVYVEAAFFEENFSESSVMKYNMSQKGLWGKSDAMGDTDRFEITLNLESFYTNKSASQRVYIKYYEGEYPNERWVTIKWIELNLPACQGLEADPQAEAAGGEFILDANGDCQWNGAWSYNPETGEWTENSQTSDGTEGAEGGLDATLIAIVAALLLAIVGGTVIFMRRGADSDDDFGGMEGAFGADALDPTEQYVQQLIAQGYPEETARAFAAQYVGQAAAEQPAGGQPAAAQPAAAQPAAAAFDQAVYEQYYQQFVSQGYDAATAAAYAQQYAIQYAQSQQ